MERVIKRNVCATVKSKALAAIIALVAAVALPQLFHVLGRVSGLGTGLGETLLPMHLAVLAVGLLAGPIVGVAVGAVAPVVSFALSGMPIAAMLPFMTIELAGYGLTAGLLSTTKMPGVAKVLAAQIGGRAVRALAVVIAVYAFSSGPAVQSIWLSIVTGLPGILLQLALIPLFVYRLERKTNE